MSEDKLTMWLMEQWDDSSHFTEVHYNHYGSRGVADLVTVDNELFGDGKTTRVIEIKSDAAIEASTGANEILRQFNKQQSYFKKGVITDEIPLQNVKHHLIFQASAKTVQHVLDNISLYGNPKQAGSVLIREVGELNPAIVTRGKIIVDEHSAWLGKYVDLNHEKITDYTGGSDE